MPPSRSNSPTSPKRKYSTSAGLSGFRPAPKPNSTPVGEMTVRELQDRHHLNARILGSPDASSSTYVQRVTAEQAVVESRLIELHGMETINTSLKKTTLRGEGDMQVDQPPEPPSSRTLEAKRKALAQFASTSSGGSTVTMKMDEAMEIERAAFMRDRERQQRIEEKKQLRMAATAVPSTITEQERRARIWAFMNYKPTDSDLEDDDDSDDDDPASWFDDDQDDGRKGQDLVEPDEEDYSDIIRVDASRAQYSTFYEPRDEGD
ncbi:hypothetical protein CPB83DRAFT_843817 [Crepidotus variabilis]|uniref:Uncharacterized protein n=1 Tax=Crepidotus variabilis TaxID=179855 RepID=A0A9P6ESK8_9AGAR|nr:hypothetical protein CPB83DRAFT_843817 [Crepidotus variabilis]